MKYNGVLNKFREIPFPSLSIGETSVIRPPLTPMQINVLPNFVVVLSFKSYQSYTFFMKVDGMEIFYHYSKYTVMRHFWTLSHGFVYQHCWTAVNSQSPPYLLDRSVKKSFFHSSILNIFFSPLLTCNFSEIINWLPYLPIWGHLSIFCGTESSPQKRRSLLWLTITEL